MSQTRLLYCSTVLLNQIQSNSILMKIHKVIQSKLDIKKQTCKNSETQGDKRLS